jgi:hypothetical protein
MTSPLAKIFMRARREYDPILIHYSQPSIQVDWLIESTVDGSTWLRRFSSHEADHNRMAKVRNSWLKIFQDLGYSPRFISSEQLTRDGLFDNCLAFVMPTSLALSEKEGTQIRDFLTRFEEVQHRVIFADGTPGLFDEHGKLRGTSEFEAQFPLAKSEQRSFAFQAQPMKEMHKDGDIAAYSRQRLASEPNLDWARWVQSTLTSASGKEGISREVTVPLESRTRIYRYSLGKARLVAFERNINYHMSEDLKQAGGNEALEKPAQIEARLASVAHIYDLRAGKYLGRSDRIGFRLDPWQPSLFALLERQVPEDGLIELLLK